jgi:hypothetical protein
MKLARLDVFGVVDAHDVVVVSPHYRPARDEIDDTRRPRAARGGRASYAFEQVLDGDSIRRVLVVESVRVAEFGAQQLTVGGGVEVGNGFIESITSPGLVAARIVDGQGQLVTRSGQDWDRVVSRTYRLPLADA